MVSRGFSHAAASLLLLAMGSSAFLPAKLMSSTGVAPRTTPAVVEKLESCDDLMKKYPGKVCSFLWFLYYEESYAGSE